MTNNTDAKHPLDTCKHICTRCADLYGGTWPDDHAAIMLDADCDCCGSHQGVCNVSDWNWPDGKRYGARAGAKK